MATGAYSFKFVPRTKPKDKSNDAGHLLVTTNRADIGAALEQQWADKGMVSIALRISSFLQRPSTLRFVDCIMLSGFIPQL